MLRVFLVSHVKLSSLRRVWKIPVSKQHYSLGLFVYIAWYLIYNYHYQLRPLAYSFFLSVSLHTPSWVVTDLIETRFLVGFAEKLYQHQQGNLLNLPVFAQALQRWKLVSLPCHSPKPERHAKERAHLDDIRPEMGNLPQSWFSGPSSQPSHRLLTLTPKNLFLCCNSCLAPTVTSGNNFCPVTS